MPVKLKKIKVSKPREGFDVPVPSNEGIPPYPPDFRVSEKQMPEIKGWPVGKHYRLIVDVRLTEKEDRMDHPVKATFDLTAYKYLKPKTIDEMSDKEFGEYQGEALDRGKL